MQHALSIDLAPRPQPAAAPTRFVFGGVAFDVHTGPGLEWALTEEHLANLGEYAQEPVFARVHLAVTAARELTFEQHREIVGGWEGDVGVVRTSRARVEIRDLGGSFAATARVAPDATGCANLCTAVLALIAERRGAAILHAVGVELDGRGVLFIGPSGAGKSTAANHCERGRWFARDRAIAFPVGGHWFAMGLPGGGECDLERSERGVLPLDGVYRIRQAVGAPRVELPGAARRLACLRESHQTMARSADAESALLRSLLGLEASVEVAELFTVLGESLDSLVTSSPASRT